MFGSCFPDQRFETQTQVSGNLDSGHYLQQFSYSCILAEQVERHQNSLEKKQNKRSLISILDSGVCYKTKK